MPDDRIEAQLGTPRLQKYFDLRAGDHNRASTLHEWSVALGQALIHDIAHFEIALRNAHDVATGTCWSGGVHWLLDLNSPAVMPIQRVKKDKSGLKRGSDVNYRNRCAVDDAIRKCGGTKATAGRVMAELSFDFWRHLTSASYEKTVWVPYLHHAYPLRTDRATIDMIIGDINDVRNRIAHHKPIFDRWKKLSQEPDIIHESLMEVFKMIAPDATDYVKQSSAVTKVSGQRP